MWCSSAPPRYSLGVLQRIRKSRWVRGGLFVIILVFCSYALTLDWPQVHGALESMHWYSIAGALGTGMAGAACMMLAWRRLLADLGSKLPIPVAARVTFMAQLGKYVPGAVWSFAAFVELGHDYDVPRRRGAASVFIALAVGIVTALLIAAATLPLASPAVARKYLLFLAAVPVIAICLAPPILRRLLDFALKIIRQEPLEQPVSWRGLAVAVGWATVGWLLGGLQVWLLMSDIARGGVHLVLVSIGAYALACTAALLLVVFPGGIGAREVILVAALTPVLPPGAALAVALVVRAVTTASDVAWGGIALVLARKPSGTSAATYARGANDGRRKGRHRKSQVTGRPVVRTSIQASSASAVAPAENRASQPVPEVAA
jgi:uncharacterized membrane protein YbhN (UPF0104 family)